MIVFEPELWGVSPLIPDGKTPTFKPAGAQGGAAATSGGTSPAKSGNGLKLWDGGSFDFHDILDVINPLQHLPIINSIYRGEVKDEIGAVPRLLGSMLYGGGVVGALIGAASAIVNIVVEHETGKDLGQHIYTAIFGEGAGSRRTTEIAASKTTKSGEAAAGAAKTNGAAAATAGAAAAASTKSAAKPISAKADAALRAYVAGLAKSASPGAAAAANAAITNRAFRVTGSPAAQAAANGKSAGAAAAKGDVSTQFRRADWYRHNQAILKAQAAALAKRQAAAANAAKSGGDDGKAGAAILHLFTKPGAAPSKPAATKTAPARTAPAVNSAPAKPAAAKPTAPNRGAVAGPWVVNEIANGLSKYEALVKARKAEAAAK